MCELPDSRFENLPEWPYAAQYVEIDGLRQAYVDEGPADADPILLLHGQPSWSYLYRKMIPALVKAGHRVIAMDHVGLGRSDKPVEVSYYSYLGHAERLKRFIQALKLQHITLFVQDWGSLIGLKVAGENPDWFDRIIVGDGTLPVIPPGLRPMSPVKDPDRLNDKLSLPFGMIPYQQVPFYDADGKLLAAVDQRAQFRGVDGVRNDRRVVSPGGSNRGVDLVPVIGGSQSRLQRAISEPDLHGGHSRISVAC